MINLYLEKREPERNMQRFYRIVIAASVFGDWAVIREWGRIGSPGTVRKLWFDSEDEAYTAAIKIRNSKEKKGYQVR